MKISILVILTHLFVTLAFAGAPSDQLTATIIGSGSPVTNPERASASVLISNEKSKILVDMGNGTQMNLNKLNERDSGFSALLFTHHHIDHDEEFVPIFIHTLLGKNKFQIIGTPNTKKLVDSTLDFYREDINYRLGKSGRSISDRKDAFTVKEVQGGETFEIDGIKVTTREVPHTIHCVAYRFDYKGKSIVISGDLTYTKALSELAKNADILIMDSGGMKYKKKGKRSARKKRRSSDRRNNSNFQRAHVNLSESSKMAGDAKAKTIVFTHFLPGEIDETQSLQEIRKNYKGNVIFGKDLLVVSTSNSKDVAVNPSSNSGLTYPIVDTNQERVFNNTSEQGSIKKGDDFYGQDGHFIVNKPSYTNNGNGTITDNITGLMWQKEFTVSGYDEAVKTASTSKLGGFDDWRLPTIKELYSLILFSGVDASSRDMGSVPDGAKPFINTAYFGFKYGSNGKRVIDTQYLSTTIYKGLTMGRDKTVFGVNMADGRIKGYPMLNPRTGKDNSFSIKLVRGNSDYGQNNFMDNKNGTISDLATGLMWTQEDSVQGMNWQEALAWVQSKNNENYLGHNDWKLPNAKELHSILDYSRSPQTSNSAAINPLFHISTIKTEDRSSGYPFFWSSTTHKSLRGGRNAVYFSFGEALGFMKRPGSSNRKLMDVHGAGAQRSDPKTGDPADYPTGNGPQGDAIRIYNYIRLVRNVTN
jgi:ribonuclease BN (tRNA processing enzyme)